MYYEPVKKTTYRFPSASRNTDFNSKYYFPEKSSTSIEDTRLEASYTNHTSERESFYDV